MPEASRPERALALVTGASAGLGAAFAKAYAARGLDVALVARRGDRLVALGRELSDAHGIEAFAIVADLSGFEAHIPVMDALNGAAAWKHRRRAGQQRRLRHSA